MTSSGRQSHEELTTFPCGWLRLSDTGIVFEDDATSDATKQLAHGIIRRTFNSPDQVADLIQRQAADARVRPRLRRGELEGGGEWFMNECGEWCIFGLPYPLVTLAIDNFTGNAIPSIWAAGDEGEENIPVVLPRWSSRDLERGIINALIQGGADINGEDGMAGGRQPICAAISGANEAAVDILIQHNVSLRGMMVMELPFTDDYGSPVSADVETSLMSIYRRLIRLDSTLATEQLDGANMAHRAAYCEGGCYSQAFIDDYMNLLVANGVDIIAEEENSGTPLREAAIWASSCVAHYLCRQPLAVNEISRDNTGHHECTILSDAADIHVYEEMDGLDVLEEPPEPQDRVIPGRQLTVRVLLRAGAAPSIARMPTAPDEDGGRRQCVLTEYTTVLNELPDVTMSAINAALAPQRDHSMLLARLLPLAPHHDGGHPHPSPSNMSFGENEAEAIAWKIGAFLHEPSAAGAAIDQYLIGDSQLRRRVKAAVGHFVKSAATQTSSNREVVGGTRYQQQGDKRVKVTVPPLQCFAVRGSGGQVVHKMTGVREVVHRARLDEADGHGVEGVVKSFNEHLGDQDCQFAWPQLGRIDRQIGLFVPLGIE